VVCISNSLMVGGGIAGLSAAIALGRVSVKCDVVELADAPLGASIVLSGRAADALDELGVYDECSAISTRFNRNTTAGQQFDAAGRLLSAGPPRPDWPGSKAALGFLRPLFLKILAEAAQRSGANIQRGITAEEITEQDDGALVTFSDGSQRRYDLVIGADGIGSRTRPLVFPDAPKPAYSGQVSVRWMLPGPPVKGEGWYNGPVGKLGFYYLPQGLIYVPAVFDMPQWKRMTDEEVHSLFTRLLDSYTAPAMAELRNRLTPDADLICRPFEWILVPAPWYRNRTLLIGDAAHATTAHMGMGGGMAVEDAVVLGQCIAQAPTLGEALEAFMARRFDRVRTVVESSLAMSRLEQANAHPSEKVAVMTAALRTLAQPY